MKAGINHFLAGGAVDILTRGKYARTHNAWPPGPGRAIAQAGHKSSLVEEVVDEIPRNSEGIGNLALFGLGMAL
jgi:hypothetical protein